MIRARVGGSRTGPEHRARISHNNLCFSFGALSLSQSSGGRAKALTPGSGTEKALGPSLKILLTES